MTQNVKDLLASREIENILDNTDFMILLSQAQSDRTILAKQLGISEHQLSYITHSNSGEGLLFYGNVTIPFVDRFPRGEIYDLLTTRPEDMKNETKTNKTKEEAWSQTAHAPDEEQPGPEASDTSGQSVPKSKFRKRASRNRLRRQSSTWSPKAKNWNRPGRSWQSKSRRKSLAR